MGKLAIELLDGEWNWWKVLCPFCGEQWTHQGNVQVFSRSEDQPTLVTTVGAHGRVRQNDGIDSENPSLRRDALRLHMTCEVGHIFQLDIIQHKGQTWLIISGEKSQEATVA